MRCPRSTDVDKTFTVGFDNGEKYNEISYAKELSELIPVKNYSKTITPEEFWGNFGKIQPVVFTAVYHALARRVRRKLPALRNLFIVALFAVNVAQLCAAPQIVLKCRG